MSITDYLISNLFRAAKIDPSLRDEFVAAIRECVNVFERRSRFNSLGPYPERKFHPHQENIIDFLTEVWQPWLQAEALTRPILRKQDPKAYTALANWLRKNDLPPNLKIPTRSEALDREPPPADFESLKESAKRFHTVDSRLNRARYRNQRRPAP